MYGMFISARGGGKQRAMEAYIKATMKGRDTMKTIKRKLIGGYVQFEDGTYGKEVAMDRLVQLARDGMDANLTVTEDDTLYIAVHEDEASAFEPSLFFDDDDLVEDWFACSQERREADALAEFYNMYSDDPMSQMMLTSKIVESVDILESIWELNHNLYEECMHSLREDMTTDMKTLLSTMDVVHDPKAKHIFNVYMSVWQNLNFMEDE